MTFIIRVHVGTTLAELGSAAVAYQPPSGSPPERRFKYLLFAALARAGMLFEPGFEITLHGEYEVGSYRLDYALESGGKIVGFEVDGLAYHGDQAAFARDRKRDRSLALGGIETFRYTANEVTYQWPAIQRELETIISELPAPQPEGAL